MKVLKINYQTYKEHQQYVIINGKVTHASYDFPVNISCTDLNNGTYLVEYDYTKYWIELTSMEEHDSQFLGLGIKAAKWYNTCTLERTMMNEGKIVIEKVIRP